MGHVCLNWKLWMGNRAWTWTHEKWVVRFPRGGRGGGGVQEETAMSFCRSHIATYRASV